MTAEQRRDDAIAAAIAVGASVLSTTPMATADDPHTVVAYDVRFGAPDPSVLTALDTVRDDTEINMPGLLPWVDPDVLEVPDAPLDAE